MRVLFHVNPIAFQDRRTAEQLRHSDSIVEKRWRWRVKRREEGRAVNTGRAVSLERRLGSLGPDRQRGGCS